VQNRADRNIASEFLKVSATRPADAQAKQGRVLIIAGSDSGGGAGLQADIKTVAALGGYAMTAVTALTAQNTQGVFGIFDIPTDFIRQQIRVVLSDLGADCIKIGMLHTPEVIEAVAASLASDAPGIPIVLDPVMMAKGGQPLLVEDAVAGLARQLVPMATVLTPNLPEADALAGQSGLSQDDLAQRLLALGPHAVLVKGGHGAGPVVTDVLAQRGHPPLTFESPRIDTLHTHGTGCTLASAMAVGLAQGLDVRSAVTRARAYVLEAIRTAPGFGHGHGPLNHGHTARPFAVPEAG
jgi:hydroxymethylpyrimidine/phosphomethylpyrimidine kinase